MPEHRLKSNKGRCTRCKEVIESRHRHDFVKCGCGASFTDGGLDYIRRNGPIEDLSEYQDD